jgi:hypothetical protein
VDGGQIEAYKDMIAPVVDAFKYLTQVRCCVLLEVAILFRLVELIGICGSCTLSEVFNNGGVT